MSEQFVNVRMQSMNEVDINQFQFEYDLTWMAFFQDANGRTYTRYGGREDHNAESHLNKESLLAVMKQVLELHKTGAVQPNNRYEPFPVAAFTPEQIPTMKRMMSRRKESCIHCHDVKGARLRHQRDLGKLTKEMVFTYPAPSRLGIHVDPKNHERIRAVDAGSPAHQAGLRQGDVIRSMNAQRVLTFADATRVLELAPKTGTIAIELERNSRPVSATVRLPRGWRSNTDPSWRPTTGTVGPLSGIWGKQATNQQRKQLRIPQGTLAMRVTYIWADWAKKSGIKHGDVIVSVDGYAKAMTIRQFQAYLHLNRDWGDRITLDVLRGGKKEKVAIQFPDMPTADR